MNLLFFISLCSLVINLLSCPIWDYRAIEVKGWLQQQRTVAYHCIKQYCAAHGAFILSFFSAGLFLHQKQCTLLGNFTWWHRTCWNIRYKRCENLIWCKTRINCLKAEFMVHETRWVTAPLPSLPHSPLCWCSHLLPAHVQTQSVRASAESEECRTKAAIPKSNLPMCVCWKLRELNSVKEIKK